MFLSQLTSVKMTNINRANKNNLATYKQVNYTKIIFKNVRCNLGASKFSSPDRGGRFNKIMNCKWLKFEIK